MPDHFAGGDIDWAVSVAGEVEAAEPGDIHSVGRALVERGTIARATKDPAGVLVMVDGLVLQLHLNDAPFEHWGNIPLGPMMEMDGSAFPPYVGSFPTSVFGYLEARVNATKRDDARARYGDFLWCHRRSYGDAQVAIKSYRKAGAESDPDDIVQHGTAMRYLSRAAELSVTLNYERQEMADLLLRKARAAIDEVRGGYVWSLTHALGHLARERPKESAALVDELIDAAEQSDGDSHRQKTLLESAEAVAVGLGNADLVRRARTLFAEACEREADARLGDGWLVQIALLRDTIEAYERVGDGPAVQRLKTRLAEAAIQSEGEMHEVSGQVTIPNEVLKHAHDDAVERIARDEGGLLRLPLILGVWPRWSAVKDRFEAARQQHPMEWLATRITVDTEGRVNGPPADEAERDQVYLLDFLSREVQMTAGLSMHVLDMLRESGVWSADAVISAIQTADDSLAASAEAGVRAFEQRDYWTAVHVLVPQFERGIRRIEVILSANVRRLVQDQGLQVATLGVLLADETLRNFLGEETAKTMEAIFTEPRGLNIRNNTAHGLLDPADDHVPKAFLALMGVLTAAVGIYLLRRASEGGGGSDEPPPSPVPA